MGSLGRSKIKPWKWLLLAGVLIGIGILVFVFWRQICCFTRAAGQAGWGKSGSFLTACTGLNLAISSWEKFQEKLRHFETQLIGLVASRILTAKDEGKPIREDFFYAIIPFIRSGNERLWNFTHAASIVCVAAGLTSLYFGTGCFWSFLLLIPSGIYLSWTSIMLGATYVWVDFVAKMHAVVQDDQIASQINALDKDI